MMLTLLRTIGFLVSATNDLNLLNKKTDFFQFDCFQSSHCMLINTAYRRLLKETHEEIRKSNYTNRATTFSLLNYFKSQQGSNHWILAKCRSRLTSLAPPSSSPLPIFFFSFVLVLCLTLFVFVFYETYDLEVL